MCWIAKQYQTIWECFRRRIFLLFWTMTGSFLFLVISSAIFFSFRRDWLAQIMAQVMQMFSQSDIIQDGVISAWRLFLNNLRASFLMVVLGLIPFLFLPAFALLENAVIIGVIGATGMDWKTFAVGILPHGIFEIPAILLATTLGFYLCLQLVLKIVSPKRKEISLKLAFSDTVRCYILVIVPLLLVAALIESYITPWLLGFFVG